MFDQVYICTDNRNLCEIKKDIEFSWETKYVGRKIIPQKYEELFDHNGYYFENEQYDMYGIVANINPTIDENGYITEISSYKVKDSTCGHGRPQTEDRDLGKRDISHFSKILDSVTIDHVGILYDALKTSFTKGELLPGGYCFYSTSAKGITLCTPSGELVLLSKANILRGLVISQTYIDVLFSPDTLKSAPEYFAPDEIPLYLAVFSKVNYTDYRNYAQLMSEAENRVLLREAEAGYPALIEAVATQNLEKIISLIKFAPLVVVDRNKTIEPPIIIATRSNNIEIVRTLLAGGAFSKEAYLNEQQVSVSPLHIAVQQQNYEMITLLCQYHGAVVDNYSSMRYGFWINVPKPKFKIEDIFSTIGTLQDFEALRIILPFAAQSQFKPTFSPKAFPKLTDEAVDFMVSIKGAAISWPMCFVKNTYQTDRSKCCAMLQQGCELDVVDFFIEMNDYNMFELAISSHRNIQPRASFNTVYERGGAWYDTLYKVTPPEFNYMVIRQHRDRHLEALIRAEKFDTFKSAVENMKISFPVDALGAFCNYPKDGEITEEMQSFFEYVLKNCNYTERLDTASTMSDVAFCFYTEALLCNASIETVQRYLQKYPLRITHEDAVFKKNFESLVEHRRDDAFAFLLNMKLAYDTYRPVEEKWSHYSGFANYRQQTIFETFKCITFYYRVNEADLARDYRWVNKKKAQKMVVRWLEVLRQFVQIVPIAEIDQIIKNYSYKRHKDAQNAVEYAIAEGVESETALSLLRTNDNN